MLEILDYKEGLEITEPCIVRNVPIDIYHKMPALSNSGLKTLLNCPAKYYYKYLSGEHEIKEKPAQKIGKAAHCYILEGREKFEQIYWVNPYSNYNKDEKVKLLIEGFGYDITVKNNPVSVINEFLLESTGIEPKEILLSNSELNQIVAMARTIRNDKKANKALSQEGESELSLFWQDEDTGVWLKCRPDFMPYDCINFFDYKTSDTADPRKFLSSFINYGYHIQAAMYEMGIKAVTGCNIENFYFIVQEKEAPYITQLFNPEKTYMLYGQKAVHNGIQKYLECKEKGIWESYSDKVIELRIEPPPDDLNGFWDKENAICYAPYWIDREFERYE